MVCMRCGRELLIGDTEGLCWKCLQEEKIEEKKYLEGWVCPKCGNVYSPFIDECKNCNSLNNGVIYTYEY